ncbi:DASH complex subunit ask1 [Tulasnella sp. 419]|nr:DASH complex subunit ask1 [Tulasnella sp. 419]
MSSTRQHFVPNPDPASIVVPGVDPNAPPTVQLEQIEQLITLRMANIDNNLAKAHQIITSQILPSIQRFARVSQPTRDAARFWKSFFEAAAQVQVTPGTDYSSTESGLEIAEDQSHLEASTNPSISNQDSLDSTNQSVVDRTPNEHSFADVVASTPARSQGRHADTTHDTTSSDPTWSPSHGSLVGHHIIDESQSSFGDPGRQEVRSHLGPSTAHARITALTQPSPFLGEISSSSDASSLRPPELSDSSQSAGGHDTIGSADQSSEISGIRRAAKGKGRASGDLRQNVLRQNARGKGDTKLAQYNPFVENSKDVSSWNGIVDLSTSPSLSIVAASTNFDSFLSTTSSHVESNASQQVQPKSMPLQPQASKPLRFPPQVDVVATPSKAAAELMVTDLLAGYDLEDTPGAGAPTPPSLARYKTYGNEQQPKSLGALGGPWRPSRPQTGQNPQHQPYMNPQQSFLEANPLLKDDDEYQQDFDDEDSFLDDDGGAYHQEYSGQQDHANIEENVGDDSFDSDMSFDGGGRVSEPPARYQDLPQQDEDTLFGPRGNPPAPSRGFQLETQDSIHTYMGGRLEDALPMQGSPTPFAGDFVALDRRRK